MTFRKTRGLISLVNDNHVYSYLKEIMVCVYFGSNVNNQLNQVTVLLLAVRVGRAGDVLIGFPLRLMFF